MEQVVSRDGTPIAFWTSGSGLPLLFVHGASADHLSWAEITPLLEPHLTVYTMDRRGRGESGDAPDYDLMREAEDIVAVVDSIGGPVSVFGHSFGGLPVLEAALLTDRIGRLILYEPAVPTTEPSWSPGALQRMQALIDRGELEAAMVAMFREAHISEEELATYRRSPLWAARIPQMVTLPREMAIDETYRFDPRRFADLRVPALLLLGTKSASVERERVETVHAALPNSRIVLLPGQEHLAHHTDPELLARTLLRFLQE